MKTNFCVLVSLVLAACSSGPEVRDTSHDDPQLVAEINRLAAHGTNHNFTSEKKFSPRRELGWATYKMTDKRTNTVSILEIQVLRGPNGRQWIETKRISPTEASVTRIETSTIKNPKAKTAGGKLITQKAERVVMWKQGEREATELPSEMIALSNKMASNMAPFMVEVITKDSPKRSLQVAAGKFPVCFVHKEGAIFLLKEAEETCYSSQIPTPYIVLRESDSEAQELLRYGWGSRSSFLPSKIKIVVDNSFKVKPPKRSAE